ncbi:CatB-related O-acetyltransferase [Methylobacterium sp. 1973]|uniref:CatB-related O-acetyltransferase n=1 Tax=Methylobacterium sp. 1973 TaxID=3156421 RepID=UPI0033929985
MSGSAEPSKPESVRTLMTQSPFYPVLQSFIRPDAGIDVVGNEYESHVQIVSGTEIQGRCFIGRGTWLNNATVYQRTRIGRYCSMARGSALGAPSHPVSGLSTAVLFPSICELMGDYETEIGHDVWVGANATILSNVSIGTGAVIGAGAVVTKDVQPYAIMMGVPAREVRRRFDEETCHALLVSRWWEVPHERLIDLPMDDVREALKRVTAMRKASADIESAAIEHLEAWLGAPDAEPSV